MKTIAKRGSLADYLSKDPAIYQDKVFVFEYLQREKEGTTGIKTEQGYPAPKLPQTIQAIGTIYYKDPKTGLTRPRIIRYIPGESSIYKDEQTNDKDYPKKIPKIKFDNNRKIVQGNDSLLLDFMMAWDINNSKQDRDSSKDPMFMLVDNSKNREKFYDISDAFYEAETFCRKGDLDEVLAFARVKGINMNQDSKDIRFDLIKHIDRSNPKKFLDDKKNPSNVRKHFILDAISKGYLIKNDAAKTIAWASNPNQPIVRAPMGLDPVDEFVKATFTTDGEEQFQAIKNLVLPPSEPLLSAPIPSARAIHNAVDKVEGKPLIAPPTATDEQLFSLFEQAKELGIIVQKKGSFKYETQGCIGKANFITKMKNDNVMLIAIKEDVAKAIAGVVEGV